MSTITCEEVKESLSVFDIDVSESSVLEKLLDIANLFDYDADTVVNEWLAYQSTHNCTLTISNLEKLVLEKAVAKNRAKNNKASILNRKRKPAIYTAENIDQLFNTSDNGDNEVDNLLDSYCTPGSAVKHRVSANSRNANITPKSGPKAKLALNLQFGGSSAFSPSILSSPGTTSSQKYVSRNNSGEVLSSFGPNHDAIRAFERTSQYESSISSDGSLSKAYEYMFQKIVELSDVMNDMIEAMGEIIKKQHNDEIEAYAPCSMPSQQPVVIVGRVCCDQGGGVSRLNPQSVILQGDKLSSYGKSVAVDLSQIDEYSIFPGQIIAMSGANPTGRKFIASKIYSARSEKPTDTVMHSDALSLLVASGPFTTSDSLTFEPLIDLISVVKSSQCDITVLIGPFLDEKNEQVKNNLPNIPFNEFFQDQLHNVIEALKGQTQLVIVSSQRELGCHPVYPQPPYNARAQSKGVKLVADPCILDIDGVRVAVTSNDILFHLGAEEISKVKGPSDRLGRLSRHLLHQRSFYPLCPANEKVNIDLIAAEDFGSLRHRPDILILPSDLKCFVKNVEDCICVNPGKLAKGTCGGSYARILIEPRADNGATDSSIETSAQIIRI